MAYKPILWVKVPQEVTIIGDLHGKPGILDKVIKERELDSRLKSGDGALFILEHFFLKQKLIFQKRNLHIQYYQL